MDKTKVYFFQMLLLFSVTASESGFAHVKYVIRCHFLCTHGKLQKYLNGLEMNFPCLCACTHI